MVGREAVDENGGTISKLRTRSEAGLVDFLTK
jgi:hypothetical protein